MGYLSDLGHSVALGVIRRSPAQLFLFRCYNRFTKAFVSGAVVETTFGRKIFCQPADLIQSMIYHFGVWEPDVSHVVRHLLSSGDVIADVGANIGYDTLLASTLVGASGQVVAVEAAPATFRKLRSNIDINGGAANIRALNIAVSDEPGTLVLYTGNEQNIGAASTVESADRQVKVTVESLPLDQILSDWEKSHLRLIKMDIEGGEAAVLRRFLSTINMYCDRVCLIVEASPQYDAASWIDLFEGFRSVGFFAYGIENSYSPVWYLNWQGAKPLVLLQEMPTTQMDILFTRDALPPELAF